MEFHEQEKVDKYYVIPVSLMRWLKILVVLLIGIILVGSLVALYVYLRMEVAHYPSRILTALETIAKCV